MLHTWAQKLIYHPHLHGIVPAGGLTSAGNWKDKNGKFLFSVKALSIVFKNKFIDALKALYDQGELVYRHATTAHSFALLVNKLRQKKWVIHSKPSFAGRSYVLEYLGLYTHKIAISNYRLISLGNGKVTFTYRDRKVGDIQKMMTLTVDEFVQRFSWHILPKGFIKIRHYGLFANRVKESKLAKVKKALEETTQPKPSKLTIAEVILKTTGRDVHLSPSCKARNMMIFQ